MGLSFNATAPSFILTGNQITTTGGIVDNSLNLETVNLPITSTGVHSFAAVGGGTMLFGGVLSGTGAGINKTLGGVVTLTNNNTYTGTTTVSAGTLTLDFTGGAANNIIPATALIFAGGTLNVIGTGGATTQTTGAATFNPGASGISASGSATLTLGAMTPTAGGAVMFNGPLTTIYSGGNSVVATPVAATATLTTTTPGNGGAAGAQLGLVDNVAGGATGNFGAYATVGLYDWASTDTGAGAVGASPYTIIGGSRVTGFYVTTFANNCNEDVPAAGLNSTGTTYGGTLRFNTPSATANTQTTVAGGGANIQMVGILVTPNMGAQNAGISGTGGWSPYYGSTAANVNFMQIWQNNTLGYFNCAATLYNGRGSTPSVDGIVQNGPGTVVYSAANTYSNVTYLNGGYSVVTADSGFGAPAKASAVNLNGGSIVGNATFTLDNGSGANPRPINLLSNGGGLAATAGHTMTVDGLISGATGSGSLTIGIPASSANNNNVGLLPGSGTGTANTTAVNATGTVLLTTNETYTGNTIISSGTLQLGPSGSISNTVNIIVGSSATYDVSLVSGGYALLTNQNLMGSGTVNGAVSASSGSAVYGGTDGTYGTNTFASNLTLAAGATSVLDLGTNGTGTNDEIVVNGTLTLNSTVIHLKAPGTAVTLDQANNYTLFTSPNPIVINGTISMVWDVPPVNAVGYTLVPLNNSIILHYAGNPGPAVVSSSVSPNPAYPNQSVLITATVVTNGSTLNHITADVSAVAGTARGHHFDAGLFRYLEHLHQQRQRRRLGCHQHGSKHFHHRRGQCEPYRPGHQCAEHCDRLSDNFHRRQSQSSGSGSAGDYFGHGDGIFLPN